MLNKKTKGSVFLHYSPLTTTTQSLSSREKEQQSTAYSKGRVKESNEGLRYMFGSPTVEYESKEKKKKTRDRLIGRFM